ncbi:MAG: DUF1801 domain-containing protein [Anaerolineae bacterium]|nr:DUF1801 domain-containing protein [Anaerolineae bacterium]
MAPSTPKFSTIDEYIATFPDDIQAILQTLRQTIHDAAPDATEAISYQMPTFKLNGNLVHFAAFKHHIGLYPTPSATEEFQQELSPYVFSKGTIQFPLDQPIPYELVTRIVQFRAQEMLDKKKSKKKAT